MITKEHMLELKAAKDKATDEFKAAMKQYAIEQCPFEVGEETLVYGPAHYGKRMVITRRHAHRNFLDGDSLPIWVVVGNLLNKDGSVSKIEAQFTQLNYHHYKPYIDKGMTKEEAMDFTL